MAKYLYYTNFKETGFEWLETIPEHWKLTYSKWLFKDRNEKAKPSDEMLTASQKYGVIPQKLFMEMEQQKVVLVFKGHDILKHVEKNDFVISMRSFQGGIEYCNYVGAVSSAYVPLEPQGRISSRYFKYLFKSKPYIQALQATTNLVRDGQALRYSNFLQVHIPVLPFEEAEAIGSFLDYETAQIDTLIEKQQTLIQLLKEKRQAVISHAVTPDKNEKSAKLGYFIDLLSGYSFPSNGYQTEPQGNIALLRGINVGVGTLKWDETVWWSRTNRDRLDLFELEEGDIVFGMDRPWISAGARVAEVTKADLPCLLLQRVIRIRANKGTYQPFIKLCLSSKEFEFSIEADLTGVSVPHLSPDQVKSFPIRDIGYDQQKTITDNVLKEIRVLDLVEESAERAIQLMQERRTALISAAVTGKIDVRGWQVPDNA